MIWVIYSFDRSNGYILDIQPRAYATKEQAERIVQKADAIARARKQGIGFDCQGLQVIDNV